MPDQWEVQMWCRVLRKLGRRENFIYCSPQLTGTDFGRRSIPGIDGGAGLPADDARAWAESAVQNAMNRYAAAAPNARVAILLDGPYGVPIPALGPVRGVLA